MLSPLSRYPSRLALFLLVLIPLGLSAHGASSTTFEVAFSPEVASRPVTGRVYVMLGPALGLREPRHGPDWFNTQPFFATEAKDWKPGDPLRIGEDAVGYPEPLSALKPGIYTAQAVVRLNPDTQRLRDGEGNAYSEPVRFTVDPEHTDAVRLLVNHVVPPRPFRETERVKLVEIPSPLLSAFFKRPLRQRAAVILPDDLKAGETRPVLYIIPGFGGDHFMAHGIARGGGGAPFGADFVRVVLDPDCGTGHHVFADSATNGPRGKALIEEMIPAIEASFPVRPGPRYRLVTGHSSGGWSSLWLQVTYPDAFAGVWSTSPDPVDFRDFQQIDLYAAGANVFHGPEGDRRPVARMGTRPVLWYDAFSRLEDVIGDGGQLHSFEAVFSPLGDDGRSRPLWDRKTGAVDPETAKAWEKYDIRLTLARNWDTLGPQLKGKLHIFTGDLDTFYLEGAVKLLKADLQERGSDAVVEIIPGKDHGSLLDAELGKRIDRQMHETVGDAK